jgi:ABC-type multidrug transport system ATPase subunit
LIKITIENIGKKFKNEWIFKNLSSEFSTESPIAITGPNGSGKSTLIQCIAGIIPTNTGKVRYFYNSNEISEEYWHQSISYSAPYIELIEEFTLLELIDFHVKFKKFANNLTSEEFIKELNLSSHTDKQIKNFSSGMKQKLKLGFAFFSESKILFLDEPTANLDQSGFEWYKENIEKLLNKKLILVASNEPKEYTFCKNQLNILNFKV